MAKYVSNAFSPAMLSQLPATVKFEEVSEAEFCEQIRGVPDENNSMGHLATVQVVNTLCGTAFSMNRKEIRLNSGDELYHVQITFRPPEGKVYDLNELMQLYKEGKIKFLRVQVLS